MQVFLNELSLHEQFYDQTNFKEAIRTFYSIFVALRTKQIDKDIFKSGDLFIKYKAVKDKLFIASLNAIPDRSLADAVKDLLFNRLNAKDWQTEQQHSSHDWFECNEEVVTDTSMAELAERQIQNRSLLCTLVNFPCSKFENFSSVKIVKNQENSVDLDCVEDKASLEKWLEENLQLSSFEYDDSSTIRPTDKQTILRDTSRFASSSRSVQDRRVYKEIKTGYYWYVDNFHSGKAAHLEVFDSQGKHFGESDLEGKINTSERDPRKELDVS